MKQIFTLGLAFFLTLAGRSATFTATVSGAWTSSATWGGAGVPTTGDIAVIPVGKTVTFTQNAGNNYSYSDNFGWFNPGRIDIYGIFKISSTHPNVSIDMINAVTINVYNGGELQNDLTTTIIGFNGKTSSINGYSGAKLTLGPNPVNTNGYIDMDLAISYQVYVTYTSQNGGANAQPAPQAFVRPQPVTTTTFQLLTSSSNITFTTGTTILPIKLVYFRGMPTEQGHLLLWRSSLEQNALEYQLERSADGVTFQRIATIPAVGSPSEYRYLDVDNQKGYYRLKLMDKDASFVYSDIVKMGLALSPLSFSIIPNPAHGSIQLRTDLPGGILVLRDGSGKLLYSGNWKQGERIELQDSWKGLVLVELTGNGRTSLQKLIVQ